MNTSFSSSTEGSCLNSAIEREKQLNIRKPTLERLFEQILAYCKEKDDSWASVDQEKCLDNRNAENIPSVVTPSDDNGCSTKVSSNCNCKKTCLDSESNQIPSFSLSFGNAGMSRSCRSNTCSATAQDCHRVQCTNTGSNNRVLQIHLPESSKEPCKILISSDKDDFTVKYLKQGQQFTFSASCKGDSIQQETTSDEFNELHANTGSKSCNGEASEIRTSGKRKSDVSEEDMHDISGDERGYISLQKRQRDEGNFYDLLFKRRMEEEQKKGSETINNECSDSENEQEEETFDLAEPEIRNDNSNNEEGMVCQEVSAQGNGDEPVVQGLFSKEVSQLTNSGAFSTDLSSHDNFPKSSSEFLHRGNGNRGRFKCQYCTETFEQRIEFITHQNTHANDRPYNCPLCSESFKQRRSLKYHIKHHNGERPYQCTHCDKAFKEKYHLTVHIRTHTGERPFACTICGKAFKQTNELTSHIRTHTGEKPYNCTLCDKWFKRRSQLYHHNQSHIKNNGLLGSYSESRPDSNVEQSTSTTLALQ